MSTEERASSPDIDSEKLLEITLGDFKGNNRQLQSALNDIRDKVDDDLPAPPYHVYEFLSSLWNGHVVPIVVGAWKLFESVSKKFTDTEAKKIDAKANAKVKSATATKIVAEANAISSSERRKDELLKYLIKKDFKVAPEVKDGILRVVFVKEGQASEDGQEN